LHIKITNKVTGNLIGKTFFDKKILKLFCFYTVTNDRSVIIAQYLYLLSAEIVEELSFWPIDDETHYGNERPPNLVARK